MKAAFFGTAVIPAKLVPARGKRGAGIEFWKDLGLRFRGNGVPRRPVGWLVLSALLALANVGCGFHLRGTASASLPEALARLRVAVADSKLVNDPLLVSVKNALQSDSNVVITDDVEAPLLSLSGEHTDTQVLTVSTSGRASGYTLKYEVSFRVVDGHGKELLPGQTVRLLRDYTFDPVNVLAREQEEQELKRIMQGDAIQQIIRRLSRYTPQRDQPNTGQPDASQR